MQHTSWPASAAFHHTEGCCGACPLPFRISRRDIQTWTMAARSPGTPSCHALLAGGLKFKRNGSLLCAACPGTCIWENNWGYVRIRPRCCDRIIATKSSAHIYICRLAYIFVTTKLQNHLKCLSKIIKHFLCFSVIHLSRSFSGTVLVFRAKTRN